MAGPIIQRSYAPLNLVEGGRNASEYAAKARILEKSSGIKHMISKKTFRCRVVSLSDHIEFP